MTIRYEITQEYRRALEAIDMVRVERAALLPCVHPVQQGQEAIRIDAGGEALRLRQEEAWLVSRLEQLEDAYRARR